MIVGHGTINSVSRRLVRLAYDISSLVWPLSAQHNPDAPVSKFPSSCNYCTSKKLVNLGETQLPIQSALAYSVHLPCSWVSVAIPNPGFASRNRQHYYIQSEKPEINCASPLWPLLGTVAAALAPDSPSRVLDHGMVRCHTSRSFSRSIPFDGRDDYDEHDAATDGVHADP